MIGRHLFRDWIAANALGEMLGLGVAALIGVAVAQAHTLPPGEEILLVSAAFLAIGAYEGAIVGAAQWLVLRRLLPSLRAKEWVWATMAGAVVAWMLGRIPSALADWESVSGGVGQPAPSLTTVVLLSAAAGAALGAILGVAQWIVLRRHVPHAGAWIAANVLAWATGMPLIFVAADLPGPHASMWSIAALLLVTVGLAGAVVGGIEGVFLRRLLGTT
ncbi:MAG TPA: hypothetical protein VE974_20310 [Thermoanaerobaculia bacterium]|nr:hypothetical protein [Thermoanaerobaculia bacterium]